MTILMLVAGLALLIVGAELLIKGSSRFAARFGISSVVIGLTVVAYGTSSPEMVVSVKAALSGQSDISLGNVVGSNIFNVLFILGVSALICPLAVSQQLIRVDVPVMIAVSVLTFLLSLDGKLGMIDGMLFLGGIIAYTVFAIQMGRKEKNQTVQKEYEQEYGIKKSKSNLIKELIFIAGGLAVLVLGAQWFVDASIQIARNLGVSELVIALTIIAAGTSLPEVATSVLASIKGEKDIAVGNVVGSNIFNILGILGISSLLAGPAGLKVAQGALDFDIPVMLAAAAACLPIFASGHKIERWEGFVFLFYYASYTAYLLLKSSEHDSLPFFNTAMALFVIPLTLVTMTVIYRSNRAAKAKRMV